MPIYKRWIGNINTSSMIKSIFFRSSSLIPSLYNIFSRRCSPLQADEKLFIEAIRDLNRQASRLQSEENESMCTQLENENGWIRTDVTESAQLQNRTTCMVPIVESVISISAPSDPNISSRFSIMNAGGSMHLLPKERSLQVCSSPI